MTPLDLLAEINLDDLVSSFGWTDRPRLSRLLHFLFLRPARDFAADMLTFDSSVGTRGLPEASRLLLKKYTSSLRVYGLENIPASSALFLSNHPGMADTLALFVALNRPDLKIIALDRPFLNALPNTEKRLFYVKDDSASRITLVRQVASHLRTGGAALTFPAGHIEPDPDERPGAAASLHDWTDSVGVFLRMSPETPVVPVLVRGVVRIKSARHPLVKLRKTQEERGRLAAAFQLLAHVVFKQKDVDVRVQIGRPIYARELGSTETQVIHQAVLEGMRRLIEEEPHEEGTSML
ncbi:MAG: 1-acyl-sn-glycerol-3-phosphate acyltransferase [Chloroflexi bacterium]|nr:1-acyl-sn-glycerol-3-phosphate acyltransferase [Chloroflexota bacterium]